MKVILNVYENTFTAVLTVHVRPMYIVCLDVLSAVGESSYGLVISVTSNAYWATEESLHHVKQRTTEQLNSSLVSGCGVAANNSSGGSSSSSISSMKLIVLVVVVVATAAAAVLVVIAAASCSQTYVQL